MAPERGKGSRKRGERKRTAHHRSTRGIITVNANSRADFKRASQLRDRKISSVVYPVYA